MAIQKTSINYSTSPEIPKIHSPEIPDVVQQFFTDIDQALKTFNKRNPEASLIEMFKNSDKAFKNEEIKFDTEEPDEKIKFSDNDECECGGKGCPQCIDFYDNEFNKFDGDKETPIEDPFREPEPWFPPDEETPIEDPIEKPIIIPDGEPVCLNGDNKIEPGDEGYLEQFHEDDDTAGENLYDDTLEEWKENGKEGTPSDIEPTEIENPWNISE